MDDYSMKAFIHRENLALLKRRLAETQDDATRKMVLKLLAEEETRGFGGLRDSGGRL
jgi:hypothetical protein